MNDSAVIYCGEKTSTAMAVAAVAAPTALMSFRLELTIQ
jgi:hypothetical protein